MCHPDYRVELVNVFVIVRTYPSPVNLLECW